MLQSNQKIIRHKVRRREAPLLLVRFISLSSVKSKTALPRRLFSFSCYFSRLA